MIEQTNINTDIHKNCYRFYPRKNVSWSAIFSGALLAFGLTFLFNLLLVGVGLAVYTTGTQGNQDLAFYGFLVTLIGGFILLFIAGWKTGKLIKIYPKHCQANVYPNNPNVEVEHVCCYHGGTHGFLAWVVYLGISLLFFSFIAQSASLSFMSSSYLKFEQRIEDSNQANTVAGVTSSNRAAISNRQISSPAAVKKASTQLIAVFLIFLFGAAGSSIGGYLAVLSKKKHCRYPNQNIS